MSTNRNTHSVDGEAKVRQQSRYRDKPVDRRAYDSEGDSSRERPGRRKTRRGHADTRESNADPQKSKADPRKSNADPRKRNEDPRARKSRPSSANTPAVKSIDELLTEMSVQNPQRVLVALKDELKLYSDPHH